MTDTIVKNDVNKALYKIFGRGSESLIESWWHTPNFNFNMNTPDNIYQSGEDGRKQVRDLVYIKLAEMVLKNDRVEV